MPTPRQIEIQVAAKEAFDGDFVPGKAPPGCQPIGFHIKIDGKPYNKIIVLFDTLSTNIMLFNNSDLCDSYNENGFEDGAMYMVDDVISVIRSLKQ